MGVNFNNNLAKKIKPKNIQTESKTKPVYEDEVQNTIFDNQSKPVRTFDNSANSFEESDYDFSQRRDIPNGHSKYEYNGATFDLYRHDDEYKSQFYHPEEVTIDDFYEHFDYLEPISPQFDNSNTEANGIASTINGEIDQNTIQGGTGDCWVISTLYSLAGTEKGREIIKDSIKTNEDGTVTVSFKGVGVSYTMTPEEISQFDTDDNTSDAYSNGDNDVLVMELAVEKLWKDINSGRVQLDTNNENLLFAGNGQGITNGGLPSQLVYYLTGVESNEIYNAESGLSQNQVKGMLQKALNNSDAGSLTFGLYGNGHSAKTVDGKIFELNMGSGGHALSITDVQKDTVTFVNPWDTSVKYTMSWDEFSKLGVGYMSYSDLNKTNTKTNVKDMTDISNYNYKTDDGGSHSGGRYSYDGIYTPNIRRKGINNGKTSFLDRLIDLIKKYLMSDETNSKKEDKDKDIEQ